MASPRILLTNDDGIHAEGLAVLEAEICRLSDDVWVVAPETEQSGVSHAISLHHPLRMRERGDKRVGVLGTPADCVYVALNGLMPEPPDVVISGINAGPNLGNDVLYSGTVSAAMEAALFGIRAIAISLAIADDVQSRPGALHYRTAAQCVARLTASVATTEMPAGVLLNVNVPDRPPEKLKGLKLCRLGYTDWTDALTKRCDPRGRPYYWIGGERTGHDDIGDSDNNGISAGYATITPIHYDVTDYRSFDYARGLQIDGFSFAPDALGSEPLAHPTHPRRKG